MPVSAMIEYSRHARERMVKYALQEEWVERCLQEPELTEPDPDPGAYRFFSCMPGHSVKIRVVVRNPERNFVITVHPDRRFRCPPT